MAAEIFIVSIPVAIGIAIFRYRLYEIDVLINRAIVYGPLTAIVAGAYIGAVQIVRLLYVSATGERSDSELLIATIVAATVFWTVRIRLIGLVDRHFKEASDPGRELKAFTSRVQDALDFIDPTTMDPRWLARRLVDRLVSALDAAGGAVYLYEWSTEKPVYVLGDLDGQQELFAPLLVDGREVGRVFLAERSARGGYSAYHRKVFEETIDAIADVIATK